jgi:hypothetical protein
MSTDIQRVAQAFDDAADILELSSASSFAEAIERLEQIVTKPGYDTKKLLADQSERHERTEDA